MRSAALHNLNFTVRRSFKVTERVAAEIQANATNLLNHPQFQTYGYDVGGPNLVPNNGTNTAIGEGTNSSGYGTHGLGTFDPRQIELQMVVRF